MVKIPLIGHGLYTLAFKLKKTLKSMIYDSNIFESLGFYYMGPVDGHDIDRMTEIFTSSKDYGKPVLVHVKTIKGKGYIPAELAPEFITASRILILNSVFYRRTALPFQRFSVTCSAISPPKTIRSALLQQR